MLRGVPKAKELLIVITIGVLMMPIVKLHAQHGTSPDGIDTWTGQITAINPETREITLAESAKKGSKTFVAVLPMNEGGKALQLSDLAVGQAVRIDYLKGELQDHGKKIKQNIILKVERLPESKPKK